jgi:hypothetical protein
VSSFFPCCFLCCSVCTDSDADNNLKHEQLNVYIWRLLGVAGLAKAFDDVEYWDKVQGQAGFLGGSSVVTEILFPS